MNEPNTIMVIFNPRILDIRVFRKIKGVHPLFTQINRFDASFAFLVVKIWKIEGKLRNVYAKKHNVSYCVKYVMVKSDKVIL